MACLYNKTAHDPDYKSRYRIHFLSHKVRYTDDGSFIANGIHADSAVGVINGAIWAQAGSRITKIDSDGATSKDYRPKIDSEAELGIFDFVVDSNGDVIVTLQKQDLSKGNLADDL